MSIDIRKWVSWFFKSHNENVRCHATFPLDVPSRFMGVALDTGCSLP